MQIRHLCASLAAGLLLCSMPAFSGQVGDNLLAYWTFDDATGTTATDYTHANDGVLSGSVAWSTGADAKFGGGVLFDGNAGSAVALPTTTTALSNPGSAISFSVWLKGGECVNTLTASYRSIFNSNSGQDYYILYYDKGNAQLRFKVTSANNGVSRFGIGIADVPTTNTWYHLAAVYDGTNASIYINGVKKATATGANGALKAPQINAIGSKGNGGDQNWKGAMDDLAIWNRALSDAEVSAIANSGKPVKDLLTATGVSGAKDWSLFH